LQIEQLDLVTGEAGRRGHQFEAERFETQVDLGIHERTRMNG
jgi:hypothetical protein